MQFHLNGPAIECGGCSVAFIGNIHLAVLGLAHKVRGTIGGAIARNTAQHIVLVGLTAAIHIHPTRTNREGVLGSEFHGTVILTGNKGHIALQALRNPAVGAAIVVEHEGLVHHHHILARLQQEDVFHHALAFGVTVLNGSHHAGCIGQRHQFGIDCGLKFLKAYNGWAHCPLFSRGLSPASSAFERITSLPLLQASPNKTEGGASPTSCQAGS